MALASTSRCSRNEKAAFFPRQSQQILFVPQGLAFVHPLTSLRQPELGEGRDHLGGQQPFQRCAAALRLKRPRRALKAVGWQAAAAQTREVLAKRGKRKGGDAVQQGSKRTGRGSKA